MTLFTREKEWGESGIPTLSDDAWMGARGHWITPVGIWASSLISLVLMAAHARVTMLASPVSSWPSKKPSSTVFSFKLPFLTHLHAQTEVISKHQSYHTPLFRFQLSSSSHGMQERVKIPSSGPCWFLQPKPLPLLCSLCLGAV